MEHQLEDSRLVSTEKRLRPVPTSNICVSGTKVEVAIWASPYTSEEINSIGSSRVSWLRLVTSPIMTVVAANQSTERNSTMKTSRSSTNDGGMSSSLQIFRITSDDFPVVRIPVEACDTEYPVPDRLSHATECCSAEYIDPPDKNDLSS